MLIKSKLSIALSVVIQFRVMATEIHWQTIALRLLLTIIAGSVLGVERSRSGHPAGLRTTLLVTLAASISMIQMNLLLQTNGKPHDSYAVMDLMRLPLGILTGVGFIGAGAIIKKSEMVLGITTASTMWFATIVGLCFGGGQIVLGSTATMIGFMILWALRLAEKELETYKRGDLALLCVADTVSIQFLHELLRAERFDIKSASVRYENEQKRSAFQFEIRWHRNNSFDIPDVVNRLRSLPGVIHCEWSGTGKPMS